VKGRILASFYIPPDRDLCQALFSLPSTFPFKDGKQCLIKVYGCREISVELRIALNSPLDKWFSFAFFGKLFQKEAPE
jgi:hypothetical protein